MPLHISEIKKATHTQGLTQAEREHNKCLKDLRSTNPDDDMTRIEGTNGGLLRDSYVWILGHRDFTDWRDGDERRLLWIKGDPGKGKTMLLIGIVRELKSTPDSDPVSYFFCQSTDSRLNNATALLRSLIYQLLIQQPSLISYLSKQYDKAGRQLFEDANAFVALSNIFTEMLHELRLTRTYLVVDALDECESGLLKLLDLIARNVYTTESSRVKWLVSSRNRHDIEERLRITDSPVELSLELNAESVSGAVDAYIDHKLAKLDRLKQYKEDRVKIAEELRKKADGTFLWVALVCKELESVDNYYALDVLHEMPSDLKNLYGRMMRQIEGLQREDPKYCKSVLSTMALAYRPLHVLELATSTGLPTRVPLAKIIKKCASFLTVRKDIVYLIHQSAKEYLEKDAESEILPNGRGKGHATIVSRSLDAMSKTLKRDIYQLLDPGSSIEQVNYPDRDLLTPIRYSCLYWIDHLCKTDRNLYDQVGLCDNGIIDIFLKKHFLHWLEALSLMRNISSGVTMIRKLENLVAVSNNESRLLDLVRDARRFILYNKWVIENPPLQTYVSALVFSPARSLTREQWKKEEPEWIMPKPIMESKWSPCLQTLEGHSNSVMSVAFSHDSRQLASASNDCTVKIWDAATGECLQTFGAHDDWVNSVAFSHNSSQLASASASSDNTVKIWDAATSECLHTLKGHSNSVRSVAFSHDSRQLASASYDHTVKIWDAEMGECLQTPEGHSTPAKGHSNLVKSVTFSHDSPQLASASNDDTVKIWDAATDECLRTFEAHDSWVNSVAFSHDSRQLASASNDDTVKIWDAVTGNCLQTLKGHKRRVRSVAFSHNSSQLASASYDDTVKIWDGATSECLQTLKGHNGLVKTVAFSHNSRKLASGSIDKIAEIWDAVTGECLQTLEGHSESPVRSPSRTTPGSSRQLR